MMTLNALQHHKSFVSQKYPTVIQRSVVDKLWVEQLTAGETSGGILPENNLQFRGAQHGLENRKEPPRVQKRQRFIHALSIEASEVVEDDNKRQHHREDLNGKKPADAILSPSSPLQLPQPNKTQQQQQPQQLLQQQRVRRTGGGGGGIQWILGPLALLITGAFPALWLPSHTVFAGSVITGLLALAGLDSTFHMGATAFFLMADASARGKAVPPAPKSHSSSIPLGYKVWSFLVNLIGLIIPVAAVTLSIKGRVAPSLELLPAAALLGPYMLMLLVQWVAEVMVWHWRSPVWPVLPIVYQAYRLLQLTRGIELGASPAMNAPGWMVEGLLKGLVAWWVFVLGMQTMWVATLVGTMQQQEQWTSGC